MNITLNYLLRFLFVGVLGSALFLAGCDKLPTASDTKTETPAQTAAPTEPPPPPVPVRRPNVSQQFIHTDEVNVRLASALDELPYETDTLSEYDKSVNNAVWQAGIEPNEAVVMRIQALLNWHHHGVGAVDGKMSKNTIKAMQVFQEKKGIPVSETMDAATWQALFSDAELNKQPVLVRYTLTKEDMRGMGGRSGYHSVSEKVAEKFHMSQKLLKTLNPNTPLKAGNTITVYNPHQPNEVSVAKVVVKRKQNILYAYNAQNELVASYPTTVNLARTPKGTYKVTSRIIDPSYNSDFSSKKGLISPGPNNPVGRVWLGISKPSFGIHGSPHPERISNQTSAGCVRLTNWDALGLFGAIQDGAVVEFM